MTVEKYGGFLDARAIRLANEGNKFLIGVSKYLPESYRPTVKSSEGGNDGVQQSGD